VGHDDPRPPLEKGLGVSQHALAYGRVANMSDADVTGESFQLFLIEDILNEAETAVPRKVVTSKSENSARVLTAVLNGLQSRTQVPRHGTGVNNSSETTHGMGL